MDNWERQGYQKASGHGNSAIRKLSLMLALSEDAEPGLSQEPQRGANVDPGGRHLSAIAKGEANLL